MSHKITVICDHGDGPGGLALAAVVALVLLFGSGTAVVIGHALAVLLIVASIVAAVLVVLGTAVAVLVCRRRRARGIRDGLPPPLWRPVMAPVASRPALAPGRSGRRPAAILAPRGLPRPVIHGQTEPAVSGPDDLEFLAAMWGVTPDEMQAILSRAGITADVLAARIAHAEPVRLPAARGGRHAQRPRA